MTVPASPDVRARFNCTGGVEYDLPAGLIFFDDTDLDVYRIDADGVSALLDLVTDYSVDGGDGGTGSVTTVNTFSDGELLVVVNVPAEQGYDMIQGDGFLPDQLERQLDRQTILQQQLVENLQRILYLPVTTEESFNPGLPAPIAGYGIRINDAGDGFVLFPAGPDGGYAVSDTPTPGKVATWDGMQFVIVEPSGDTTGVTDSANMATAFADGRPVWNKAGAYYVEDVDLVSDLNWYGDGKSVVTFKLPNGSTAKNMFNATTLTDLTLRGIGFDGNASNVTAGYADPFTENIIYFFQCQGVDIQECAVANYLNYGFLFNASAGTHTKDVLVENNDFTNGGKGGCESLRYGDNIKFLKNRLYNSVSDVNAVDFWKPLAMSGTIDGEIAFNHILQDNGAGGEVIAEYVDRQSENIKIHHNWYNGAVAGASFKAGAVVGLDMHHNTALNSLYGMYIEGCEDYNIHNNETTDSGRNSLILAQDAQTSRDNTNGRIAFNRFKNANRDGAVVGFFVATVWSAGLAVVDGQVVYYGTNTYRALSAGTTGATPPTHSSGDVSDDTIVWRFVTATSSTSDNSYFLNVDSTDGIEIIGNTYTEDDDTMVANGMRVTATNYTVRNNNVSGLQEGVQSFDNHFATTSTVYDIVDNVGFQTTDSGTATITSPATTETVTPDTVIEATGQHVSITPRTVFNGDVAYAYADAGTPPAFVIRARTAAHGAPTPSGDMDFDWSVETRKANGIFGKTTH